MEREKEKEREKRNFETACGAALEREQEETMAVQEHDATKDYSYVEEELDGTGRPLFLVGEARQGKLRLIGKFATRREAFWALATLPEAHDHD